MIPRNAAQRLTRSRDVGLASMYMVLVVLTVAGGLVTGGIGTGAWSEGGKALVGNVETSNNVTRTMKMLFEAQHGSFLSVS